jgi:hypothetical protein
MFIMTETPIKKTVPRLGSRLPTWGCVITLLLIVLIYDLSQLPSPVNRREYGRVAGAFGEALRLNDTARAKSLVVAEQWERIDTWIGEHKTVFVCPSEWRFWLDSFWDGESGWGVGGYTYADPTTADLSYGYY